MDHEPEEYFDAELFIDKKLVWPILDYWLCKVQTI